MFKYLIAICLIIIACGTQSNSNSKAAYTSVNSTSFRMGNNDWVGTRINIQEIDCVVVAAGWSASQISPSISCNWDR